MMIGPAPMMRIDLISVRFGIWGSSLLSRARNTRKVWRLFEAQRPDARKDPRRAGRGVGFYGLGASCNRTGVGREPLKVVATDAKSRPSHRDDREVGRLPSSPAQP